MFKKGDFIKVKENTKIAFEKIVTNWAGEIQEVYRKEQSCLVFLDAQSINSFEQSYLISSINAGGEPFEQVFEFKDIEPSSRRDTDEQKIVAIDGLILRILAMEEEIENQIENQKNELIKEFENSAIYEELNIIQKENSSFVAKSFIELMYDYEGVQFSEWDVVSLRNVCLEILPRKITSEIEFFENYGDILSSFLKFLSSENYIKNGTELVNEIEKIKTRIPEEANNPENWGMAKSMMMSALLEGYDLSDENDMEKFMMLKQLEEIKEEEEAKIVRLREDPFKEIGRNQKITIKYNDGKVLEEVKFKKIESDLRKGLCEIIKK